MTDEVVKSQEKRIEDAARVLRERFSLGWADMDAAARERHYCVTARDVLEAADRQLPNWPTDESVSAFGAKFTALYPHQVRAGLRAAMLADPIIKAAIALAERFSCADTRYGDVAVNAVVSAVREAGAGL